MSTRANSDLTLCVLLDRTTDHLALLAAQIHDVEEMIGESISDSNVGMSFEITRLQALDYVRQCLEDLALMTSFLSDNSLDCVIEGENARHILNKLKLEVTQRLLDRDRSNSNTKKKHAIGDVDFL